MIVAFGLSLLIALSMSIGAYAGANLTEIKAYLNKGVNVKLNGMAWQPKDSKGANTYPITYNSTTWLPVKSIGDVLGVKVGWDGTTNTVLIGEASQPSNIKTFNIDKDVSSGPMKMHISKVILNPSYQKEAYMDKINAVILEVSVENTSKDIVNWYPSQGTLVLNTKEQAEGGKSLFYSDNVSGDFIGNVIKSGKIVFQVNSNLADVNEITFSASGAFNQEFTKIGEDVMITMSLQ